MTRKGARMARKGARMARKGARMARKGREWPRRGQTLQETNVLLEAVLGKTQLNLNQIANLEKGKIIVLDTKLDKKIKVKCEEIDILESEIGSRDEKMAVKILHNQIASFNE